MSDGLAELALAPIESTSAAEALRDRLGDLVVAADGGEQVHHVVRHLFRHLVPLAGAGHGVELAAKLAQPMRLEHRLVGRRRAVEGHAG